MKNIYDQPCQCNRPGCHGNFAANKIRKYHAECAKEIIRANDAAKAAQKRAAGTDTISQRKAAGTHTELKRAAASIQTSAGVRDGQTRKPSADWTERRARISGAGYAERQMRDTQELPR